MATRSTPSCAPSGCPTRPWPSEMSSVPSGPLPQAEYESPEPPGGGAGLAGRRSVPSRTGVVSCRAAVRPPRGCGLVLPAPRGDARRTKGVPARPRPGHLSIAMGLYRDHVLPRLVDGACSSQDLQPWRAEVTSGLVGRVVEIGFGSGLNVEHYPPEVEMVMAVEPAGLARRLAANALEPGGPGPPHRPGRPEHPAPRRQLRRGAVHLHPVHRRRPRQGPGRTTPGTAHRRTFPLPRARDSTGALGGQMATPAKPMAATPGRRLPSHPGHLGAGERGWFGSGALQAGLRQGPQAIGLFHFGCGRKSPLIE